MPFESMHMMQNYSFYIVVFGGMIFKLQTGIITGKHNYIHASYVLEVQLLNKCHLAGTCTTR